MVLDHLIQKRNYLLRGLIQLADEPALYKPGGGDNIEMRYHLNVGVRRVKRAYLLTDLLGGDDIAQLVEIIAPAASKLDADFAYGTVSLTIDGGRITGLSVRCTGTMQVVLVETEVSVSADVAIKNGSAPQFPEKAVSALSPGIG